MLQLKKIITDLLEEQSRRQVRYIIIDQKAHYDVYLEDDSYVYIDKSSPEKEAFDKLMGVWARNCTPLGKLL